MRGESVVVGTSSHVDETLSHTLLAVNDFFPSEGQWITGQWGLSV